MLEDSALWRKIEPALDQLLLAPPADRERLIEELSNGDPIFREELSTLVAAHDAALAFLETPPHVLIETEEQDADRHSGRDIAGRIIGRYKLLEQIARGGMGTVWLASRADGQYEQRVALRLIKRGMDTDEVVSRFLRERQILARLQHPNIARLLDGGVSDDGLPYFAMEHVVGVPITQYCREHRLDIVDRLRLFEVVCHAVQHAHRGLVVHRDLKPSNVLVTDAGDVKLLDFGIAKLLDEEETGTLTGWSRPFTPEYATPEQLTGAPITTACDVYQLGLLLHELLTDALPYHVARHDPAAARRIICEIDVVAPSTHVGSSSLRGDLDAIVLTALRKQPDERYPSAESLADDVRRHRLGRPISVRAATPGYRALKYVRRNRVRIAVASTIGVFALGLALTYTWRIRVERDRALLAVSKAGQSEEFIRRFFQGWNPGGADRRLVSVDAQLDVATRRAERELVATPDMQASLFSLLGSLYTDLGRYGMADTLLSRALRLQQSLGVGDRPDVAATRSRQGFLYLAIGRYQDAESAFQDALRVNRVLFGSRHAESIRAQLDLALLMATVDRWPAAERELHAVLDADANESRAASLLRAEATSRLGYALYQLGRFDEARATLEAALDAQRREFGTMSGMTLNTTRSLASVLRDMGQLARADTLYREAHRIAVALYGPEHLETDVALQVWAIQRQRTGDLVEAESMARAGLARSQRLFSRPRIWLWRQLLGMILLDLEQFDEAERVIRESLVEIPQLYPNGHQSTSDLLNRLAYVSQRLKRANADSIYREAIAFRERRPAGTTEFVTDGQHFLAWAMLQHGDSAKAASLFRLAASLYRGKMPDTHPNVISTMRGVQASR